MAGFKIDKQVFGAVEQASSQLLSNSVSGLMGLAFQTISTSGAKPFWQSLVEGGSWTQPLMSFVLTRYANVTAASNQEPGGLFTMGYLNTSYYTGDVEYHALKSETYWVISMSGKASILR